jgi:hypothetical protein
MADRDDDLTASKTEGFKLGEKKTLEEYKNLGMAPAPDASTSESAKVSCAHTKAFQTKMTSPSTNGKHRSG